ncbi:MAG: prepilin-type N-terminal cleavage/methylation domain-containing protein [Rickettsiales bacterium]|jgi:prepilin-type N-terminal cleavage/methylation domain-containing protein
MKIIKKKNGFSLIEISIVMLLIGILVTGISQGSILRQGMKLNSAKSLTLGSPVNAIPGLFAWYEPTLETSFNQIETIDGAAISGWHDNSFNVRHAPGSAVTYNKYAINDLPAINFTGGADSFTFDCSALHGKNVTIFAVERRSQNDILAFFLDLGGASGPVVFSNSFGYGNPSTDIGAYFVDSDALIDGQVAVGAFSGSVPRIYTFLSSPSTIVSQGSFVNGGNGIGGTTGSKATATSGLNTSANCEIGSTIGQTYHGDLAEIIIFSRPLDLIERNAVQQYLSKKYKINVVTTSG